jgi:hypothetical protein
MERPIPQPSDVPCVLALDRMMVEYDLERGGGVIRCSQALIDALRAEVQRFFPESCHGVNAEPPIWAGRDLLVTAERLAGPVWKQAYAVRRRST